MAQIGENCVRKRPEDWERVYACDDVVNAWDLHDFSTFAEISRDLSPEFSRLSIVTPKMSDSDEVMSLSESAATGNPSDTSDSGGEMEVVGVVRPYANEPLAHTTDEEEDDEEDQDGLTPDVLRARFEGEVAVNEWLVLGRVFLELSRRRIFLFISSSARSRFSSIFTLCL